MLGVYNKRKLLAQLLRVYSRLHLSEDDYQFRVNADGRLVVNREDERAIFTEPTTFIAEELQNVRTTDFVAWAMSCPSMTNMKVCHTIHFLLLSITLSRLCTGDC